MARKTIFDFGAGQVSPRFKGRVDNEMYHKACETLENFRVWPTGGIERVPGTKYIASKTSPLRLFTLKLANDENYVLAWEVRNDNYDEEPTSSDFSARPDQHTIYKVSDKSQVTTGDNHTAFKNLENLQEAQTVQSVNDGHDDWFLFHKQEMPQRLRTIDSGTSWGWAVYDTNDPDGDGTPISSDAQKMNMPGISYGPTGESGVVFRRDGSGANNVNLGYNVSYHHAGVNTPGCATVHQTRLIISGEKDDGNFIVGSKSGDMLNMSPADADGYVYGLAGVSVIYWLAGWTELLVGASNGEWSLGADAIDNANTPNVRQVSNHGSYNRQPLYASGRLLFVERGGGTIREMLFDNNQQTYNARNLCGLAGSILGTSPMQAWTFQASPVPTVWVVRGDGKIAMMTYDVDQRVIAWNTVDVGRTAGDEAFVESICCVPNGFEDEVWISVKRKEDSGYVRHIEYFSTFNRLDKTEPYYVFSGKEVTGQTDVYLTSIAVDGSTKAVTCTVSGGHGLTDNDKIRITGTTKADSSSHEINDLDIDKSGRGIYNAGVINTTTFTLEQPKTPGTIVKGIDADGDDWVAVTSGSGKIEVVVNKVTGLDHLNGDTVSLTGDGSELGQGVVSSGEVALGSYFKKANAGLGVDAICKPLGLDTVDDFGNPRVIKKVKARMIDSNCLQVGPDEDNLDDVSFRKKTDNMNEAPSTSSEIVEISIAGKVSSTGRVVLKAKKESGMSCNIVGLVTEHEV